MNRATITGRLTKDVEVRKTQESLSVASFTVAVNDGKDKTNFINCVAWRQSADFLGQYSHKGDLVGVDGKITTRSYERDGQKVYVTEVVADKVEILAYKGQNQQNDNFSNQAQNRPQKAQNEPTDDFSIPGYGSDRYGDDLPF